MFIDMDEDDGNEKNININEMFKRTDPKLQFYVDVSKTTITNTFQIQIFTNYFLNQVIKI